GGNALRSPVLARCFRRARVAAASSEGRSRQLRKRFSAIASSVVRAIVSSIRIPSPPQRGENYPFFWIKSKRLLYRTKTPACHSAPLGAYTGFDCALPPAKSLIYPGPPSIRAATERWPSGRRRSPAKGVDLKRVSWVRIPSSPPRRIHSSPISRKTLFSRHDFQAGNPNEGVCAMDVSSEVSLNVSPE